MSVYVDKSANGYGRMVMCHMIADTPQELYWMAKHIGVDVKWFQANASMPHFDIAKSKRALAIEAGAIECDMRPFVAHMKRIKPTWPHDKGRWLLPSSYPVEARHAADSGVKG